jgi:hypothetical protein
MAGNASTADIHQLLERYQIHYEICPYYVLAEQGHAGAAPTTQRVQAGFDVNLYGTPATPELPLFHTEAASASLSFFESAAREIQSRAGNHCTVEIMPCRDSLVLDPQQHFRAEGMVQIRISHDRGLSEPEGPSEELALASIQKLLNQLGIRRR